MNRVKFYSSLFEAYVEAFPTKSKKLCQEEVNEKWNAPIITLCKIKVLRVAGKHS